MLDVSLNSKHAKKQVGVMSPQNMSMTITISNNSTNPVQINGLQLSGDGNISFSASSGPFGGVKELAAGLTLQPGESSSFDVSAYFRLVTDAGQSESGLAYTATATTSCTYSDLVTGEGGSASDTQSIPVYVIGGNRLDVANPVTHDRIARRSARARRIISSAFGSRYDQMIAFSEPASLVIADADGKELATITDAFDFFVDDNLTAYCIEGAKIIVIAPNASGDYKITAKGIDGSGMDVLSYEYDPKTGMTVRYYIVESVSGEEPFMLTTQRRAAASLCRLDAQGAKVQMLEAEVYQQQEITDRLIGMGLSDEEARACSNLIVRGLIDEAYVENLQGDMTLERFCALMADVAGDLYGIRADETDDAVSRAMNMGLLSREDAEGMAEGALTVAQATTLTNHLLEMLGFANGSTRFDWAITEKEAAELFAGQGVESGLTYTLGICEGLESDAKLTPPGAALLADRMIEAAEMALERDGMVAQIGDAYKQSLNWSKKEVFVYGDEQSDAVRLYGNSAFWKPDEKGYSALYGTHVNYTVPMMFSFLDYAQGQKKVAEKLQKKGYTVQVWPELSGIFRDDIGAIYRWTPMALMDKEGKPYEDTVFLALSITREGFASRYIKWNNLNWNGGNATAEYYLVEDPQVIAALLSLSEPIAAPAGSVSTNYGELAKGAKGDSVKALQTALIKLGYLKGKADGSYGGKTVDAVNAFQQAMGLEATGTADNQTQQRLFAESADSKAFQEWLDQHIDAGTLEAADEALSRREAEGHEADFNSIIG